jgi:acetylornithine/N-succinyldiaminopimelate aminotransferase
LDHLLDCSGYVHSGLDVVRGVGTTLFDRSGRRIVDFESGVWCVGLGHSHPRVTEALRSQIERVMHLGYRVESRLAEEAALAVLHSLAFAAGKCIFLTSASRQHSV